MTKISILTVYHKEAEIINGEDFLPVNAGRAVAKSEYKDWLEKNTVGDDTGINISAKNPMYNELTAVYWAWKNLESDYYGLMHYRRHFIFEKREKPYYSFKKAGDNYTDVIKYTPERLRTFLEEYDFIAPMPMKRKSVYEHYKNAHDVSDLLFAKNVIDTCFPEYSLSAEKYIYGSDSYFYNMFVFDKETFTRYCEFMFGVLEKCEEKFIGKRMFISERLTGIFITQLIKEGKKGLFLPTAYIVTKIKFKDAYKQTKANLQVRKGGGIKSLVYAFKPLLVWLLPEFIFAKYRNR